MDSQIHKLLEVLYIQALRQAFVQSYLQQEHKDLIMNTINNSKLDIKKIEKLAVFSVNQIIEELLQVVNDFDKILKTKNSYENKLSQRYKQHCCGNFYEKVKNIKNKTKQERKVYEMYSKQSFIQQDNLRIINKLLKNTIYFPGLIKGNGSFFSQKYLVTCAHVIVDQNSNRIFPYKPFINGSGEYGIAYFHTNTVFPNQDVAFGQIIQFSSQISQIPQILKFQELNQQKKCIQIGLLFSSNSKMDMFETSCGFIEQSLYKNQQSVNLDKEMGLIIHDCYGLWGTSGSPLWDHNGKLIGIHNSWNQQSQNVSMIIHPNKKKKELNWYIIKQFERRAISGNVLQKLFHKINDKNKSKASIKKIVRANKTKMIKKYKK